MYPSCCSSHFRFAKVFFPLKNVFLSSLPTSLHMIGSRADGYGLLIPSTHGHSFSYIQSTIYKLRYYHAILRHLVHLHVSQKLTFGQRTPINGIIVKNNIHWQNICVKIYLIEDFVLTKSMYTSKRRQVFELSPRSSRITLDSHLVFILL